MREGIRAKSLKDNTRSKVAECREDEFAVFISGVRFERFFGNLEQ